MPKRKHESSPPPPPRSSTRPRQPRRISPSQGTFCSEPSFAQTEVEKTEDGWNDLKARTHERLSRYEVTKESEKLQDCFGGLLDWLPPGGRNSIAHDILDAESDEMLLATYENIRTCLLQPIKASGGKTPAPVDSPHQKRRENAQAVYEVIEEPQVRDSDFRKGCLERDRDRCVVTKAISFDKAEETGSAEDVLQGDLEAAHIIPWSFASYDPMKGASTISNMWETLYRCFPEIRTIMRSSRINEIENGLTLHHSIHRAFGRFRCAFEPIANAPHTYNFVTFKRFPTEMNPFLPHQVTFVDASQPESESRLPHPVLLDYHYRLAKFFHASGMGEVIDKTLDRLKELKTGSVLARDGTTDLGSLLRYAVWESVTV
ncbi:hypothetical protein DTO012A7_1029 [Penicillium roqueforti]|uniref:Genomic scaffold, ProqFM164S01 n=1 Tax=Penicillium roqueforti (strain FM164) TaxID=1365484 RepID=W6Q4M6_PENRF|nr:hypothetical protein CBS147372_4519 [Penicillium roqueforti]CDM29134.1 unnamed protein product [Penicillium roqueforti FM164]KAI3116681.1 hypothetical protein CBS147333_305 [Penicillium roqueforti]KAI3208599.1 hypothetical protein CBS147311_2128 [Penicillium roqueforti]KAI3245050.1 hypothetical protein DTO012A7_1029 [Penicillium roqueforti]